MNLANKRIFYTSYQPYALEYAKLLQKDLGWEPVYWTVLGNFVNNVNASFPNVHLHDYYDAIKGKLPEFIKESELVAIDATLLKSLSYQESVAINMMNRNMLYEPISYQERFRLYIRLVRFYCTLLEKLKPDFIVFEDCPHQACDYILYHLARRKSVRTILFEESVLSRYFLPMSEFEHGPVHMINAYRNACEQSSLPQYVLSEYSLEDINRKKGEAAKGAPWYMLNQQKEFKNINSFDFANFFTKYLLIPIKLFNISKFKKRFSFLMSLNKASANGYFKQKNTDFENSAISNWEYIRQVKKVKQIKKANLKYYRQHETKDPKLNIDFIFCALNFQPEKTSSPMGGYYVNPILMIQILSKSVPAGWKIYVKEHLSQFIFPEKGESNRTTDFYAELKKLENVELIPIEFKSFDLIDNAKAVASICGTVLWEAVLRGKPALAFGEGHHCFCGGCEGIFYTPDSNSVKDVVTKINSGYKVDNKKVMLYAHYIEKYGYRGYSGGNIQAVYSEISVQENALLHVDAIKSLLNGNLTK